MNELSCEDALIAVMAEADGETAECLQQAKLHIEQCENCFVEFSRVQEVDARFMRHQRTESQVDLWPLIDARIAKTTVRKVSWIPFAGLAIALFIYRLFELLPEQGPGLAFRLVPLAIVAVLFVLIKENPFKVNPELKTER